MLRARTVNVDYSEGIYMYDKSGKKYIDWCSGAVCINLGHTVPDSIRKAIID
jgi:adenosylmethionine-8-amino-7-oxononanoate aminotransferase